MEGDLNDQTIVRTGFGRGIDRQCGVQRAEPGGLHNHHDGVFLTLAWICAAARAWDFNYVDSADTPLASMSDLTVTSTGNLTILTDTISLPGTIHITFVPQNSTNGSPFPLTAGLEFTFKTDTAGNNVFLDSSPLTYRFAQSVTDVAAITSVPEPSSMALIGIGMSGLFALRRLFKRPSVA